MTARRYASYEDLAEIIRHRFSNPKDTLREMFGRLVFNILCGNTDDHARNLAAFWDGKELTLTPAYDICPQGRAGNDVLEICEHIKGVIRKHWNQVCEEAQLMEIDKKLLWKRQFLNPFSFEGKN